MSPKASMLLHGVARLLVELVVFGAAIVALAASGQRTLAWVMGLAVLIHEILLYLWGQQDTTGGNW